MCSVVRAIEARVEVVVTFEVVQTKEDMQVADDVEVDEVVKVVEVDELEGKVEIGKVQEVNERIENMYDLLDQVMASFPWRCFTSDVSIPTNRPTSCPSGKGKKAHMDSPY